MNKNEPTAKLKKSIIAVGDITNKKRDSSPPAIGASVHPQGHGHSLSGNSFRRIGCGDRGRRRSRSPSPSAGDSRSLYEVREGTEHFLADFGPAQYHSSAEYQKTVGSPLPSTIIGGPGADPDLGLKRRAVEQKLLETDPAARDNFFAPRERTLAVYTEALDRFHLDGFVYPATQMPPPDETMPQDGRISGGPHSDTAWVNMIGVPAMVVPGGFYPDGLPFGMEISARPWRDGDLLGWAFAYEQAAHHRRQPILAEKGLLPNGGSYRMAK